MADRTPSFMKALCCSRSESARKGAFLGDGEEEDGLLQERGFPSKDKRASGSSAAGCCLKALGCCCCMGILLIILSYCLVVVLLCHLPEVSPAGVTVETLQTLDRGMDLDIGSYFKVNATEVCNATGAADFKRRRPTQCAVAAWVSQEALDHVTDKVSALFNTRLQRIGTLVASDIKGKSVQRYGMTFTVEGLSILSLSMRQMTLTVAENQGLNMDVQGLAFQVALHYRLEHGFTGWSVAGVLNVGLGPDTQVSGLLDLGVDETGWVKVSLAQRPLIHLDFSADFSDLLSGGVLESTFAQGLQNVWTSWKGCLEGTVSHLVETTVDSFVERDVPGILKGVPSLIGLGEDLKENVMPESAVECLAVSITFCGFKFGSDYIEVMVGVEFVNVDTTKNIKPYTKPALPPENARLGFKWPNLPMISVSATRWVIDSFINVLEQSGRISMQVFQLPKSRALTPYFGKGNTSLVLFFDRPKVTLAEGQIRAQFEPIEGALWNVEQNTGFQGLKLSVEGGVTGYIQACQKHHEWLYGSEIARHTTVMNPMECQVGCRQTPGCKNWGYHRGTGDCRLLRDRSQVNILPGHWITGPPSCEDQTLDLEMTEAKVDGLAFIGAECKTVSNRPCKFPFKVQGKTYHQCTTDWSPIGRFWCATDVKANREMTHTWDWGFCGPVCGDVRNSVTPIIQHIVQKATQTISHKLTHLSANNNGPVQLGNSSFRIEDGGLMLWTDVELGLESFLEEKLRLALGKALPRYCGGGGPSGPTFDKAALFLSAPSPEPAFTLAIRALTFVKGKMQDMAAWSGAKGVPSGAEFRLDYWGNLEYGEFGAGKWRSVKAQPPLQLTDGAYHNLAVVRDEDGSVALYADGKAVGHGFVDEDMPTGLIRGAAAARIGWDQDDQVFQGNLGPLRVFETALAPEQLAEKGTFGPCKAAMD